MKISILYLMAWIVIFIAGWTFQYAYDYEYSKIIKSIDCTGSLQNVCSNHEWCKYICFPLPIKSVDANKGKTGAIMIQRSKSEIQWWTGYVWTWYQCTIVQNITGLNHGTSLTGSWILPKSNKRKNLLK